MTDHQHHDGRCTCGEVEYRMTSAPLVVHCCHCSWCQRESGAAFALNALLETDRLEVLKGGLMRVAIPSESGKGQVLVKCPTCQVTLWSHYAGMGDHMAFIRVGTLDNPNALPPDVHIFTSSAQQWVTLDGSVPIKPEYYKKADVWRAGSLARFDTLMARVKAS